MENKSKKKDQFAPPNANPDDYEIQAPKWWECSWHRTRCGRDDCRLCGRLNQQIKKHLARGEDPNSMEAALQDVSDNFAEVRQMLEKDAKKMGIDLNNLDDSDYQESPEPFAFPLYNRVYKWQRALMLIFAQAEARAEPWVETEEFKDICWYSGTLLAKTYRQLSSKWEFDRGDEIALCDYDYTRYIINECIKIMLSALQAIKTQSNAFILELNISQNELKKIRMEVLFI